MQHPTLHLLKSRALLVAGRKPEAREAFQRFLAKRQVQ
jgi:hypothetical protein